jgi:hypothetical protein
LWNHPSQYYYDQSGFTFTILIELECEKVILKTYINFQICKLLNSITFASLVYKLYNKKCAHHLIEGFPLITKAKQGFMVWESYSLITSKINK